MNINRVLEFGRAKGKDWMIKNKVLYVDATTLCKCFSFVKLLNLYIKEQK